MLPRNSSMPATFQAKLSLAFHAGEAMEWRAGIDNEGAYTKEEQLVVLWQCCVPREGQGNQKEQAAKNPVDGFLFCPDILCEIKVFSSFFSPQQEASTNISKQEPI